MEKQQGNKTVNIALGISDKRECEICKLLDKTVNKTETKNVGALILEIEELEGLSRVEKSYAIFLFGESVGRFRVKEGE